MALKMHIMTCFDLIFIFIQLLFFSGEPVQTKNCWTAIFAFGVLTLFRPGGGGGGLWRPYQNLKLNNFKAVKAMTAKFSDFS